MFSDAFTDILYDTTYVFVDAVTDILYDTTFVSGDAVIYILYDTTYVFGDAVTDIADEDYDGGDLEDVHDEEKEPETERHLLPPPTTQTVYL